MQTYAKGPASGWRWLIQGFGVYRRNPGTMLGASVLILICVAIMLGVQTLTERAGSGRAASIVASMGVVLVIFGIVFPILVGGFMRAVRASRESQPASAWMVLQPFRPGQGGGRLALLGLCMLVLYVAFFALVLGTVGRGLMHWYVDMLTAQAGGTPLTALAPLPRGSGPAFALLTVFLIFYSGATAIGIGQVALRGQPALAAFRDAIAGAFKNVLPLLVLAVCGLVAALVAVILVGILVGILVVLGVLLARVLGSAGAGAGVGIGLAIVIEILFMLVIYPIVIAIQVALWDDVTGGGQGNPAPAPTPGMTA